MVEERDDVCEDPGTQEVLQHLKDECEAVTKELTEVETRAREAWLNYWVAKGVFRPGDVVQHPALPTRVEWVVENLWCTPHGELKMKVVDVVEGRVRSWRIIGRDGLLRLCRRPG